MVGAKKPVDHGLGTDLNGQVDSLLVELAQHGMSPTRPERLAEWLRNVPEEHRSRSLQLFRFKQLMLRWRTAVVNTSTMVFTATSKTYDLRVRLMDPGLPPSSKETLEAELKEAESIAQSILSKKADLDSSILAAEQAVSEEWPAMYERFGEPAIFEPILPGLPSVEEFRAMQKPPEFLRLLYYSKRLGKSVASDFIQFERGCARRPDGPALVSKIADWLIKVPKNERGVALGSAYARYSVSPPDDDAVDVLAKTLMLSERLEESLKRTDLEELDRSEAERQLEQRLTAIYNLALTMPAHDVEAAEQWADACLRYGEP